jgi:hypothetical protein
MRDVVVNMISMPRLCTQDPVADDWRDEQHLVVADREQFGQQQVGHARVPPVVSATPESKYTGAQAAQLRWAAVVCLAAALAAASSAQASAPAWREAPLAGGRPALLPLVGLSPALPRAVALGELIEVAHYRRDARNAALVALQKYFASPPSHGGEQIPVPLDPEFWRTRVFGRNVPDRELIGAILADRPAALLCYGLLALDDETLDFVSHDGPLVRRLLSGANGAFAAFAHVLHVRGNVLELPGGPAAAPIWEALIGQPLTHPSAAIAALLERDAGRLAYLAETTATMDVPHAAMLLTTSRTDEGPFDRARGVYRAFVEIDALRNLSDLVFQRVAFDLRPLVAALPVTAAGEIQGTDVYWRTLLDSDDIPKDGAAAWAGLEDGEAANVPWILGQLSARPLTERRDLIGLVRFMSRLSVELPQATPGERVLLGHAFRRYPALLLTLERIGVEKLPVWRALVGQARRIDERYGDEATLDHALTCIQAPIALIDRAVQVRALNRAEATRLLADLSAIDPAERALGRKVAGWLADDLLPALGHGQHPADGETEARLLEALAGLTAPADAAGDQAARVRWEDFTYRVDEAAAELARLNAVRVRQGGNTLDTVIHLARVSRALASGRSAWAETRAALVDVREALEPIDNDGEQHLGPAVDVGHALDQAITELTGAGRSASAKRRASIAARLVPGEDAVVADTLASVVYALWLGDPEGQAFLGGNVARRHDFGRGASTAAERAAIRWALPAETSGAGDPWHVRGALLALDLGLGRLALRRTSVDMPATRPMLNEGDRRAFIASLVLMPRSGSGDRGPLEMVDWLAAGRQALAHLDASELDALAARLDLDSRRRQQLGWTASHAPTELPHLFSLTEIVQIGRPLGAPSPPGWGASEVASNGCLCRRLREPPAPHRFIGQPGTGMLVSRIDDLELTILEALAALDLPPALARGAMASALQDYLDAARPAYPDDWRTLVEAARDLPPERMIDYVSALTAGGPLVPAADARRDGNQAPP